MNCGAKSRKPSRHLASFSPRRAGVVFLRSFPVVQEGVPRLVSDRDTARDVTVHDLSARVTLSDGVGLSGGIAAEAPVLCPLQRAFAFWVAAELAGQLLVGLEGGAHAPHLLQKGLSWGGWVSEPGGRGSVPEPDHILVRTPPGHDVGEPRPRALAPAEAFPYPKSSRC